MIKICKCDIFSKNLSTLQACSKNTSVNPVEYLCQSDLPAINFDSVKEKYVQPLGLPEIPKSNDSLFINCEGAPTFIEFKAGYIDRAKKFDIYGKIFDSVLIFTDLINEGLTYTRQNMDYILVYNADKNSTAEPENKSIASANKIANVFSSYANTHSIRFGLAKFKNYCFKDVFTYSIEEFEEFIGTQNPCKELKTLLSETNKIIVNKGE